MEHGSSPTRTASFAGAIFAVSLCAIGRDASLNGMACLLTSMKPRRPNNSPRSAAQLLATLYVIPAYTWYAAPME